jgi:hypothetical protein
VPKLVLIGAALVPVFALAGLFIVGVVRGMRREGRQLHQKLITETEAQQTEAELEEARAEIAALKAQMALEDQGVVQTTASRTARPTTTPSSLQR